MTFICETTILLLLLLSLLLCWVIYYTSYLIWKAVALLNPTGLMNQHTNTLHSFWCRQSHLHKSTECTHIVRITKNYYYYEIFFYTYYPRLLRQRLRNKASQIKKKKCFKRGSCHYLFTTKAIDAKTSLIKYQMFKFCFILILLT